MDKNESSWYSINLGDALSGEAELRRIQALVQALAMRQTVQAGYCYESSALHCEIVVYLGPGCEALALKLLAQACPPPRQLDEAFLPS